MSLYSPALWNGRKFLSTISSAVTHCTLLLGNRKEEEEKGQGVKEEEERGKVKEDEEDKRFRT